MMIDDLADLLGLYSELVAEMMGEVRECQCNSGGLDFHAFMQVLESLGLRCRYHKIGYLADHLEQVVHSQPGTITFVQIRAPGSVHGTSWCIVRELEAGYITIQALQPPDVAVDAGARVIMQTMGIAITVDARPFADAITQRRLGGHAKLN